MRGPGHPVDVLLVSSSGGVLLDLLGLSDWWRAHERSWVAVAAPDTVDLLADETVQWCRELSSRSPFAVARATAQAARSLRHREVGLVASAGTGVAVPWFVAAWMLRVPRVWVETFNVVGRRGLASRVCAALSTTVLVQHSDLLARHRRAVDVGALY